MPQPCAAEVKWIMIRHMLDGFTPLESSGMLYRSMRTINRTRRMFRMYGDIVDPMAEAPGNGRKTKLDSHVIDVCFYSNK
jgi:hypothetical protein